MAASSASHGAMVRPSALRTRPRSKYRRSCASSEGGSVGTWAPARAYASSSTLVGRAAREPAVAERPTWSNVEEVAPLRRARAAEVDAAPGVATGQVVRAGQVVGAVVRARDAPAPVRQRRRVLDARLGGKEERPASGRHAGAIHDVEGDCADGRRRRRDGRRDRSAPASPAPGRSPGPVGGTVGGTVGAASAGVEAGRSARRSGPPGAGVGAGAVGGRGRGRRAGQGGSPAGGREVTRRPGGAGQLETRALWASTSFLRSAMAALIWRTRAL